MFLLNLINFDVDNITINDYTSSEIDYDLKGIIVLNNCQSLFTVEVSDNFCLENEISFIEKIEFTLDIRPVESYIDSWNTELILKKFKN